VAGALWLLPASLGNLAELELREGNLSTADALGREALTTAHALRERLYLIFGFALRAATAATKGRDERAGYLWGAAVRLDDELGPSAWWQERAFYEQLLGERSSAFERGFDAGRRATLDDAVATALSLD
jgi:hypothetical protein